MLERGRVACTWEQASHQMRSRKRIWNESGFTDFPPCFCLVWEWFLWLWNLVLIEVIRAVRNVTCIQCLIYPPSKCVCPEKLNCVKCINFIFFLECIFCASVTFLSGKNSLKALHSAGWTDSFPRESHSAHWTPVTFTLKTNNWGLRILHLWGKASL